MAEPEIYAKLTELFHDIFNDESIVLSAATTARDIDGWDSLSNIRLILSVETAFRIRLSAAQAASLANLGGLVELIAAKLRVRAGA